VNQVTLLSDQYFVPCTVDGIGT